MYGESAFPVALCLRSTASVEWLSFKHRLSGMGMALLQQLSGLSMALVQLLSKTMHIFGPQEELCCNKRSPEETWNTLDKAEKKECLHCCRIVM